MDAVFARRLGFYLTGGTALSRFHLHHRYSDVLDLFTHEINSFGDAVRVVRSDLEGLFDSVVYEVDAREFKRLSVHSADLVLTVDFVADRAPRAGLPENRDGAYVDTVRNILSNKLVAILSRDEPRDVADLLQICRSYRFHWDAILREAARKQVFEREDLASLPSQSRSWPTFATSEPLRPPKVPRPRCAPWRTTSSRGRASQSRHPGRGSRSSSDVTRLRQWRSSVLRGNIAAA